MNIWHDINPKFISKDNFTAVIEIPKGGKNKKALVNVCLVKFNFENMLV